MNFLTCRFLSSAFHHSVDFPQYSASVLQFTFPYTNDTIFFSGQLPSNSGITPAIVQQFLFPIFCIVLGRLIVLWATMPKTPVHEYANSLFRKCKIRFPRQIQMSPPPADMGRTQKTGQLNFRAFVVAPLDFCHQQRTRLF